MLKKRIIPCLDVKDGRTVKGTNFINLKDAGDPIELAKTYANSGADELVFLDISASNEKRRTLVSLVEKVGKAINIPFTVGGGISSLEDAKSVVNAGADKIVINSSAVTKPSLIKELSDELGSQAIVVAIDVKKHGEDYLVYTHGGSTMSEKELFSWAIEVQALGAGEILLTSMDHDGMRNGFALSLLKRLCESVSIPVVASGGAGTPEHFLNLFQNTPINAALAAGIFHFGDVDLLELKEYLKAKNIAIR